MDFFDKIESEIKNKYDEYYKNTIELIKSWNECFNKFDNQNRNVIKINTTTSKSTNRIDLEKTLHRTINQWFIKMKISPRNSIITYSDLIQPFERNLINYIHVNGSTEEDILQLLALVLDLKILFQQWEAYQNGYSIIFHNFSNDLNVSYQKLSEINTFFSNNKIKWFCS